MGSLVYSALIEDILVDNSLTIDDILKETTKRGFKVTEDVKEYIRFSLENNPNMIRLGSKYHFNGNFTAAKNLIKFVETSRDKVYAGSIMSLYEGLRRKVI